jgi:isoleucyl-tRNA synthetase
VAEVGPDELGVTTRLAVNARAAGPRLGRGVQDVIRAAKAGDWERTDVGLVVQTADGPVALEPHEYELATVVADSASDGGRVDQVAAVLSDGGVVLLDTALDAALLDEGWARDVVRLVQDARKAAGLAVSDRIRLMLVVPQERSAAAETHRAMIARETLATDVRLEAGDVADGIAGVTVERAAEEAAEPAAERAAERAVEPAGDQS